MVKSAFGDSAFYGRGAPMSFITDSCDAERKAWAQLANISELPLYLPCTAASLAMAAGYQAWDSKANSSRADGCCEKPVICQDPRKI